MADTTGKYQTSIERVRAVYEYMEKIGMLTPAETRFLNGSVVLTMNFNNCKLAKGYIHIDRPA